MLHCDSTGRRPSSWRASRRPRSSSRRPISTSAPSHARTGASACLLWVIPAWHGRPVLVFIDRRRCCVCRGRLLLVVPSSQLRSCDHVAIRAGLGFPRLGQQNILEPFCRLTLIFRSLVCSCSLVAHYTAQSDLAGVTETQRRLLALYEQVTAFVRAIDCWLPSASSSRLLLFWRAPLSVGRCCSCSCCVLACRLLPFPSVLSSRFCRCLSRESSSQQNAKGDVRVFGTYYRVGFYGESPIPMPRALCTARLPRSLPSVQLHRSVRRIRWVSSALPRLRRCSPPSLLVRHSSHCCSSALLGCLINRLADDDGMA